ncbi:hypothetical protein WN48_06966 [Eufriesea mexicana]|uniref:Uncharacterized protein n=1 Tax=Eufriesea mexicana TaxID=516756 RepID=A0A310STW1_9HYME|nr:hypothetical protein WN48_05917 [Eufriesea mexicana]OAD62588.1 hypothetical protein WN48_06966 [Eufriesea mexicana]
MGDHRGALVAIDNRLTVNFQSIFTIVSVIVQALRSPMTTVAIYDQRGSQSVTTYHFVLRHYPSVRAVPREHVAERIEKSDVCKCESELKGASRSASWQAYSFDLRYPVRPTETLLKLKNIPATNVRIVNEDVRPCPHSDANYLIRTFLITSRRVFEHVNKKLETTGATGYNSLFTIPAEKGPDLNFRGTVVAAVAMKSCWQIACKGTFVSDTESQKRLGKRGVGSKKSARDDHEGEHLGGRDTPFT